jgi:hypothetical protein
LALGPITYREPLVIFSLDRAGEPVINLLRKPGHISLSQYAREIVISRSVGHAKLPMRAAMLEAVEISVAEQWVRDEEVPRRQVSAEELGRSLAGESRLI